MKEYVCKISYKYHIYNQDNFKSGLLNFNNVELNKAYNDQSFASSFNGFEVLFSVRALKREKREHFGYLIAHNAGTKNENTFSTFCSFVQSLQWNKYDMIVM